MVDLRTASIVPRPSSQDPSARCTVDAVLARFIVPRAKFFECEGMGGLWVRIGRVFYRITTVVS